MKAGAWSVVVLLFFASCVANVMAEERRDIPKKDGTGTPWKDNKAAGQKRKAQIAKKAARNAKYPPSAFVAPDPKSLGLGCSSGEEQNQ